MNLKLIGHGLIVCLSFLQFSPASAIPLNFSPTNQAVDLNQSFSVDVVFSGPRVPGEIVLANGLDVSHDARTISATNIQFGPDQGNEFFLEVLNAFDLAVAGVIIMQKDASSW